MAEVSRKVLGWRLKALPYLYSAFYDSHTFGCPIARPLWFNFPSDPATLRLQEQWMMGGHLTSSRARDLSSLLTAQTQRMPKTFTCHRPTSAGPKMNESS